MPDALTTQILEALVSQGLLADASRLPEVQEKLDEGATLEEVLVDRDMVEAEALAQVKAGVYSVPYVDLRDQRIAAEVLQIIPESTARGHMIIAYEQTEEALLVAMADPNDRQIVEFIRKKVDMPVEVALASEKAIRGALGQYQQSLEVELGDVTSQEIEKVGEVTDDLDAAAGEVPIVRITQSVLKHAIIEGASDIHIEPTEKEVIVRYRVDGILHDKLVLPRKVLAGLVARIKVLSNLKIDEHRLPQDGRFKIESDEYKVAFRVSTLPVYDGEKVVMRLLDESGQNLGLDDIGMRAGPLEIMRRVIKRPHGMVLVTGPTGSGKTTTLYAVMREISTPDVNISTIEDPIEYRMPRINQTQVKPKIGLTFSMGLRALVRQDPDVIMVGEIRDEETAALAVNAALTGHLVLSTLHTNSAAGALPRLRDMQVEAFLLASTLNMILAQRLVRRLCEECRKKKKISKETVDDLASEFDVEAILATMVREKVVSEGTSWTDIEIYEAGSCEKCADGYKGRLGIYEVLEVNDKVQPSINSKTSSQALEAVAREQNSMVGMVEDGIIKSVEGMTSLEEVLRVARE